jgi:hypothetical protein
VLIGVQLNRLCTVTRLKIIIITIIMLIDVAIPGDRNVILKEAEKILKYKYLTIEYSVCGM